ncbi:MAG: DHH family phosphoesterase [Gemmatales bacterium]|nr:DHH family phosphoesterase [Gemmatales bacterium]MDW8175035.1 DHH family phosphoesterase [Gemmatales bacterium]
MERSSNGSRPGNGAARNGPSGRTGESRSGALLASLQQFRGVYLISHINPDPDSLGSMAGLAWLIRHKLNLPTQLTRDGILGRAENRAMVECLQLQLLPVEDVEWRTDWALIMVDSQPGTGRHNVPDDLPILGVIDHHETPGQLRGVSLVDVRSEVGATCTIVASYLQEQAVAPSREIATALFYGIESEISGYPREASALDDETLVRLYPLVNQEWLARIRHARLPRAYFEALLQALQDTFIYDDRLIISWADELPQPELTAEIADLLIRLEGMEWSVCAGVYEDRLLVSMRSAHARAKAGVILQQVIGDLGTAGGHDRRAGGAILLLNSSQTAIEKIQSQLRKRLLQALRMDECRGQRLVSRKELLENLQA